SGPVPGGRNSASNQGQVAWRSLFPARREPSGMSETGGANDASTLTAAPAGPTPPSRRRLLVKPRRSTIMLGFIALVSGVAFATVFAFVVTSLTGSRGQPPMRTTGIPKTVSTKLATLMQLSPVPVTRAPGFMLTD